MDLNSMDTKDLQERLYGIRTALALAGENKIYIRLCKKEILEIINILKQRGAEWKDI